MESSSVDAACSSERRGILVVLASEPSDAALFDQAVVLAQSHAVPLFVICAESAELIGLRPAGTGSPRGARAALSRSACERLAELEIVTDEATLPRAVSDAAARWRPSLLLLSADRRVDGALAVWLANTTLIPVLVWRASGDTSPIVVATALRDPAYPVLRCASDLAASLHASLVAFHNVSEIGEVAFPVTQYAVSIAAERAVRDRKALLDFVLGRLKIRARSVVTHRASTASAIVEAACDEGAGLIVVGTHPRAWWRRMVLPELARRVVDTAGSSVVVVPMCA